MTKVVDIKTFYRPDNGLIELLNKRLYAVHDIQGHRFTAVFLDGDHDVATFCANHDHVIGDFSYNDVMGHAKHNYKGLSRYVFVGISLKEISGKQYGMLNKRNPNVFAAGMFNGINPLAIKTNNPNLYIWGGNYVWAEPLKSEVLPSGELLDLHNTQELEFVKSLEGFDFWYSYSDSLSVYRAGEARQKEIIEKGVGLGLTKKRAEELYTLVYQSSL